MSRRPRLRWRVIGLALVTGLWSCAEVASYDGDVSIAPESTARHVVFVIESTSMFYGLSVFPCGSDRSLWTIGGGGSVDLPPSRIVYGETPSEFQERAPAKPLVPGCYRVEVSGEHAARFTVNRDGAVRVDTTRRDAMAGRRVAVERVGRTKHLSSSERATPREAR